MRKLSRTRAFRPSLARRSSPRFAFERTNERIDVRVPKPVLDALKARASHRGIPDTCLIRKKMQREIALPER